MPSQGLLFLLEHEGKAALTLNIAKDARAQQQQDPHPRLSCATWHGDIAGPAPVPGHAAIPEGPWDRQALAQSQPLLRRAQHGQGRGQAAATRPVQPSAGAGAPLPCTVTGGQGHLLPPWALAGLQLGSVTAQPPSEGCWVAYPDPHRLSPPISAQFKGV